MISNYLVLVRHGQSEWNEKNLFTGWKDPGLTQKGVEEAKKAGYQLNKLGLNFDIMHTSALIRAQLTGQIILDVLEQDNLETIENLKLQKNLVMNKFRYGEDPMIRHHLEVKVLKILIIELFLILRVKYFL